MLLAYDKNRNIILLSTQQALLCGGFFLSIVDAGEFFKFRCPLDGEYKIGSNWAETH